MSNLLRLGISSIYLSWLSSAVHYLLTVEILEIVVPVYAGSVFRLPLYLQILLLFYLKLSNPKGLWVVLLSSY